MARHVGLLSATKFLNVQATYVTNHTTLTHPTNRKKRPRQHLLHESRLDNPNRQSNLKNTTTSIQTMFEASTCGKERWHDWGKNGATLLFRKRHSFPISFHFSILQASIWVPRRFGQLILHLANLHLWMCSPHHCFCLHFISHFPVSQTLRPCFSLSFYLSIACSLSIDPFCHFVSVVWRGHAQLLSWPAARHPLIRNPNALYCKLTSLIRQDLHGGGVWESPISVPEPPVLRVLIHDPSEHSFLAVHANKQTCKNASLRPNWRNFWWNLMRVGSISGYPGSCCTQSYGRNCFQPEHIYHQHCTWTRRSQVVGSRVFKSGGGVWKHASSMSCRRRDAASFGGLWMPRYRQVHGHNSVWMSGDRKESL